VEGVGAARPLTSNLDTVAVADLVHAVLAVALLHLAFNNFLGDEVEVDAFFELELPIPHLHKVVQDQAGHMIEVPVDLLHGEAALLADLAPRFVLGLCFLVFGAGIAEVRLGLGDGSQPIAMLVEAGVTIVAVEHLVAFVVGAAEAYLAVGFELAVVLVLALVG
jgi:hypothetical protein